MKTLRRVCASTALALIVSATCFAHTIPKPISFPPWREWLLSPNQALIVTIAPPTHGESLTKRQGLVRWTTGQAFSRVTRAVLGFFMARKFAQCYHSLTLIC
jgi:hypothetical protein